MVVVGFDVLVIGKVVSKLGLNDMVVTSFVEVIGKIVLIGDEEGLTEVLCGFVVSTVDDTNFVVNVVV